MRRPHTAITALICSLLLSSQIQAADVTNEQLAKACSEKTIVYGRDDKKQLVLAGEKLDGFCAGYIQATFSALLNSSSCKEKDSDPDYLLSVYRQYVKDMKVPDNSSASATLTKAFRRVSECR